MRITHVEPEDSGKALLNHTESKVVSLSSYPYDNPWNREPEYEKSYMKRMIKTTLGIK